MVLIAIPNMGKISTPLVKRLMKYDKREDVQIEFNSKVPVDVNRNDIVNWFLDETDHEYLCMIDADIVPQEDLLDVLEYDKEIISPIVFSMKEGIPYPVISTFKDKENLKHYKMEIGSDEEVMSVDGVGTGCIFIKRNVFEELEKPYFHFRKNDNGTLNTGEDMYFTQKAKRAGFDIHIAMDYVASHFHEVDLKHVSKLLNLAIKTNMEDIYFKEKRE